MKNAKILLIMNFMLVCALLVLVPPTAGSATEMVDAIVFFESGYNLNIQGVQYRFHFEALNGFSGLMSITTFEWLQTAPFVKVAELNGEISLVEDQLDWGVDDINAEHVWGGAENAVDVVAGNVAGQGVKVCVLDTGIDYNHPDLNDNYKGGYDFYNDDNDPMDDHSHGTHCAGIIAAEDNEQGVIGVAPEADLYAGKVLSSGGSGSFATIAAGIDWAVSNNMDVISMSLGGSSGSAALQTACDNAWNAGLVIVAASGNDYGGPILYPARYSSCIAIGATDSNRNLASFSNKGPEQELVAPGVSIYSTVLNGNYGTKSGTSMATPMVAGVTALVLSANTGLSNSEVRNILQTTAIDLGAAGWDETFGHGLVDAPAAVDAATGGGDTTPPTVSITNPANGATVSGTVLVTADASDNVGVANVKFYIDDVLQVTDSSVPYEYSWDTTAYTDGGHTVKAIASDAAGNTAEDIHTVTVDNDGGGGPITHTFTGSISQGADSVQHEFNVPGNAQRIEVNLEMPSGTDFDLSLWDDQNRRTGGWTSSDYSTKTQIPNSAYSGYSANPEWINVDPVATSGTWKTGCYSYRGSGTYTISVTIYVAGADTTPPTVSITNPADGATVSDTVSVTADASDNVGVAKVEFYIDDVLQATDTSAPYSYSWDTTTYTDGSHSVKAIAYDAADNTATDVITVTVDNAGPIIFTFTGSISSKQDSIQHEFSVPGNAQRIEVNLEMPSGTDFDLSLWDDQNRRTGGWISSDFATRTDIPNSTYSGYSANPEWINVDPVSTSGTWKTGCYAYSGSGTYTITVTIYT